MNASSSDNQLTLTIILFLPFSLPVMAAIAVRKKVISIGHFSPCFRLQSLQIFLFVSRGADSVKLPRRKKIPTKAAAISLPMISSRFLSKLAL